MVFFFFGGGLSWYRSFFVLVCWFCRAKSAGVLEDILAFDPALIFFEAWVVLSPPYFSFFFSLSLPLFLPSFVSTIASGVNIAGFTFRSPDVLHIINE